MNESVNIRLANIADAELLTELGRETFDQAFSAHPLMPADDLKKYLDSAFTVSQITSELNHPDTIFLVAEIDAAAAGYARLDRNLITEGVTGKNPIKLKRLYAKQKFIGSGFGAALMKRCLAEAEKSGHDVIWLTVWEHNRPAQMFYQKWEFKTCGRFEFTLGNSVLSDLVMERFVDQTAVSARKNVQSAAFSKY